MSQIVAAASYHNFASMGIVTIRILFLGLFSIVECDFKGERLGKIETKLDQVLRNIEVLSLKSDHMEKTIDVLSLKADLIGKNMDMFSKNSEHMEKNLEMVSLKTDHMEIKMKNYDDALEKIRTNIST